MIFRPYWRKWRPPRKGELPKAVGRGTKALPVGVARHPCTHKELRLMPVFLRNPWSSMARHLLAGLAVATAAAAQDVGEPHLTPVSRTLDEAALVATLTAIKPKPSAAEAMPGGAATVPVRRDDEAFSAPSGNLPPERLADFRAGKALFAKLWIAAPSALVNSDGLGPLYNARSCQACHVRDGRGHPPTEADGGVATMVLRLSIPALAEIQIALQE
ncbi:MAG: hypothetical protein B7Y02_06375, partial [Rhodobacterales bacterium 17-64-5]